MKVAYSKIGLTAKAAAMTAAVAFVAIAMVPAAMADVKFTTTGGTACKGSSGSSAPLFYFSNQTAQNTSASGQYVTCELPVANANAATTPTRLEIILANPTGAGVTFTCAVQSGYEIGADSSLVKTAVYNVSVTANGYSVLDASASTTPVLPTTSSSYAPYTLTCLVPAQGKVGVIAVLVPGTL